MHISGVAQRSPASPPHSTDVTRSADMTAARRARHVRQRLAPVTQAKATRCIPVGPTARRGEAGRSGAKPGFLRDLPQGIVGLATPRPAPRASRGKGTGTRKGSRGHRPATVDTVWCRAQQSRESNPVPRLGYAGLRVAPLRSSYSPFPSSAKQKLGQEQRLNRARRRATRSDNRQSTTSAAGVCALVACSRHDAKPPCKSGRAARLGSISADNVGVDGRGIPFVNTFPRKVGPQGRAGPGAVA